MVNAGNIESIIVFGLLMVVSGLCVWSVENQTKDSIATVKHILAGKKREAVSFETEDGIYGPRFFETGSFKKGQEVLLRSKGSFGRKWRIVPPEEYENNQ